jgi:hypothetical protein
VEENEMKRSIGFLALSVLALFSFAGDPARAQSLDSASRQNTMDPVARRNILRGPNGIERLSSIVGDVTLNNSEERWGEYDLSSLTSGSDFVVRAVISQATSRLAEDGDSILTDYNLEVSGSLKGQSLTNLKITCQGGKVSLANGHTAILQTPTWERLQTGSTYILFIKRQGKDLTLVGASQGLLSVDLSDQTVHSADTDPRHSLTLKKEVEGINSNAVELAIRHAASSL